MEKYGGNSGGTALVTGGAGFLGSHVADYVLRMGRRVVVLDDLSGGSRLNVPPAAEFVTGSVEDDELLERLFQKYRFESVYHLAAYAAEGLSHFIRRFNYSNNLLGTVTVMNAAIRAGTVRRFVFTSSIAVYGAGQVPMDEETTPHPEDPYGISKYAAELDLEAARSMFGLPYTIFRPHNVYGERQNIGDRYRNVIGIFMNQIMRGEPMTIFGDGSQTRAFTHVDDVAPIIAGCVDVPCAANEVFNIGADKPYSVLALANLVAAAFGVTPDIRYLDGRNEVAHAYSSHEKARTMFNASPQISLKEGIERMATWARKIGPMDPSYFGSIEVRERLPASWQAPPSRRVEETR